MPFRPPQRTSGPFPTVSLKEDQRIHEEDDEVSDVSSTLPRFLTPGPPGKGAVNPQGAGVVGKEIEGATSSRYEARTSEVYRRAESEQVGAEARFDSRADIRDDESSNILGEAVSLDRVSERNAAPVGYASQPSERWPPPLLQCNVLFTIEIL